MSSPIRYSDTSTIVIDDNTKTLLLVAGIVVAGVAAYVLVSKIGVTLGSPTLTPTPLPTSVPIVPDPTPNLPVVQTSPGY